MTGSVDEAAAVWVAQHRLAPLDGLFVALGTVEKLGAIWIACALVLGLASRRGIGWTGALVVLTGVVTFAADSLSFGAKDLADRPRPFVAHPQIHPLYVVHSSSFPAGHAATAFAGATLLAFLAPRLAPAFVALAALIAWSRVYDGVHYPSDVLAGAVLGALVGVAAAVAARLVE